MSSMRSRKAAAKVVPVMTMRPVLDQLAIISAAYRATSAKPLSEASNRKRLRALAVATVMTIDAMPA